MYVLVDKSVDYCDTYVYETEESAMEGLNLQIERYTGVSTEEHPYVGQSWHGYDSRGEEVSLHIRQCERGEIDHILRRYREVLKGVVNKVRTNVNKHNADDIRRLIDMGFEREDLLRFGYREEDIGDK